MLLSFHRLVGLAFVMRRIEMTVIKSPVMQHAKKVHGSNTYDPKITTDMLAEVRRDLVMATSVMAALSSFMFGLATNLPIALA